MSMKLVEQLVLFGLLLQLLPWLFLWVNGFGGCANELELTLVRAQLHERDAKMLARLLELASFGRWMMLGAATLPWSLLWTKALLTLYQIPEF